MRQHAMIAASLVVAISWLGCYCVFIELAARRTIRSDWPLRWILASTLWAVLLTWIVEASSAFRLFTAAVVVPALVAAGVLLGSVSWLAAKRRTGGDAPAWASWRAILLAREPVSTLGVRLLRLGATALVLALGVLALSTATTNFDSMTYHLPRVMHWLTRQSVAFYPTMDWRQLEFGPWAGFAVAAVYMPAGNDHLANLVQWFAMTSSAMAAAWIARELVGQGSSVDTGSASDAHPGIRQRAAALAAALVVSVPIGIAESITTQNDYVTVCWLLFFVVNAMALARDPQNITYTLGAAGALATGFLTKSNMALFAAPFVVALGFFLLVRLPGHRARLRTLLVFVVCFAAINGPHMWRNFSLYGSPLGSPGAMLILRNDGVTVSGTFSNVVRNLALHAPTGVAPLTTVLNGALERVHELSGRSMNDPGLTFPYTPFRLETEFVVADSTASGAWHLFVFAAAIGCLGLKRVPHRRRLLLYGGLVLVAAALFCALLRWQPWHARFHLAYFVLFAPLAAAALAAALPSWIVPVIGGGALGLGVYCTMANISRPLTPASGFLALSREEQYFLSVATAYPAFRQTADEIVASGCRAVGLFTRSNDFEYPIWAMLQRRGFDGRLFYVGVASASASLPSNNPEPCAVIATSRPFPSELSAKLPTRVSHSPLTVHWADLALNWAVLTRGTPDGPVRLADREPALTLDDQGLELTLHTVLPGQLELTARPTLRDADAAVPAAAFRVTTSLGQTDQHAIGQGPLRFGVRSEGGPLTIALSRIDRPSEPLALRDLRWVWAPERVSITRIANPNGVETVAGERFFWVGRGETQIEITARARGDVRLYASFLMGPSLPSANLRRVRLTTDTGYRAELTVRGGPQVLTVPVSQPVTIVTLTPLDAPTVAVTGNNDTRPLLLGVAGLKAELH